MGVSWRFGGSMGCLFGHLAVKKDYLCYFIWSPYTRVYHPVLKFFPFYVIMIGDHLAYSSPPPRDRVWSFGLLFPSPPWLSMIIWLTLSPTPNPSAWYVNGYYKVDVTKKLTEQLSTASCQLSTDNSFLYVLTVYKQPSSYQPPCSIVIVESCSVPATVGLSLWLSVCP